MRGCISHSATAVLVAVFLMKLILQRKGKASFRKGKDFGISLERDSMTRFAISFIMSS